MLSRLGPRLVAVPLIVIAVVLASGWWVERQVAADPRPSLVSALDALPAGTVVAGFTDWSSIRERLGLDDAALRDLTTRSVLGGSVERMHEIYGWSAEDVDWESYGQSAQGAALVARLSGSVSLDDVEQRLRRMGYTRSGQVWSLGDEARQTVGQELAAVLGTLAVLRDRRLVVATGTTAYARTVLATIVGDRTSLLGHRPVADLATELTGSDSVLIQARTEGCRSAAVGAADADVAGQATAALCRAGQLVAPTFTGRGLIDGARRQDIRFVAAFGSPAEAAEQLRVRETLATGPFIGRSGRIEDSLDLVSSTAHGSVTSLRFALDPDRGAYMSGEGPLLFASCP